MAIAGGDLLEITMNMTSQTDHFANVWSYEVAGTFTPIPAAQVAEAWWNDVKAVYRAMITVGGFVKFTSVVVRDAGDPLGDVAEFSVPPSEVNGTRTAGTEGQDLPSFNAASARLVVASRVTRPGQKRLPGLVELDNSGGVLQAPYVALANTFFTHMVSNLVLVAPALGMELNPQVFRKDALGAVTAHQDVIGFVLNPNVSSQVSRKPGRGA